MSRTPIILSLAVLVFASAVLRAKPSASHIAKPAATPAVKGVQVLSKDGNSIIWQGKEYKPIDDTGVYYYDVESVSGVPMPMPRTALRDALSRNGFHGVVRCELVDYVDCTKTDHGFVDDGKSRVLRLADGNLYRVTGAGGRLSWFSYFLRTRPVPGRPHLVVVQTINDIERYTTVSMTVPKGASWAPPYTGEEKKYVSTMQDDWYHPDVGGCVYTGREYPLDGKHMNYMFLYYPKARQVKVTVSHFTLEEAYQEINGAAVARIWLFDILDPMDKLDADPIAPKQGKERRLAIYEPHGWFMYAHYGIPAVTKEQRQANLRVYADYLKFCGINQVQFHVINGSDVARCAWYDSKLYDNLQGNLIEEFSPIAAEKGIELVPIVAPIMTPYGGNLDKIPDKPDKDGFCKLSLQLDRDGKYANTMGCYAPDPLRPEVQEWMAKCLREVLDRVAKYPNIPGVAFRVNGKIGLCYVGYETDRCGQDKGYSEWDISEFEKDTGIKVPRMHPTPYSWIRANAWEQWEDWRCKRMHDFWLRMRDLVRSYRPDLKLIVACDLPSEYPGYNIEWVDGIPPRELMRHHGYDPELFKNDEGIIIQRGMMIASDRYWSKWGPPHGMNYWAHKAFNYAEGVVECYGTREGQAVEFYHNYWEEDPHPDNEYGATMRTGTGAPWGQYYFEPATYSIRKANVHTMAYMGWERASIGHEHDLRRFARAYRALPYTEPKAFDGTVKVLNVAYGAKYRKPENPDVWVKWFGDRLAVVNDTGDRKYVELTIPRSLPKGNCLFDFGAKRSLISADQKSLSSITIKLPMLEHDIFTLGILPLSEARKYEAVVPVTSEQPKPGKLALSMQGGTYAGQTGAVKFAITNTGKSPITNVDIDVEIPGSWVLSSTNERPTAPINFKVGSIPAGKTTDYSVGVSIPASEAEKTFWITATVVYQAGGKRFSEQRSLVVMPKQPLQLTITPQRFDDKAAGDTAEITLRLSNKLSQPATARISFDTPEGWLVTGSATQVEAKAGGDSLINFRIVVPSTAKPGKYKAVFRADAGEWGNSDAECMFDVPLSIRKAIHPITVDGDESDWDEAAPGALAILSRDFRRGEGEEPAADLAPHARVAWDDKYLYIVCSIAGGVPNQKYKGSEIWKGDSVQFGIDSARGMPGAGSGYSKIGFAMTEKGLEAWRWDAPIGKEKGPLSSRYFSVGTDGQRQCYEAAIPWDELPPFKPAVGKTLGLTIAINFDRGRGREYVRWYSGITEGNDPSRFASIVLR